MKSSSVSGHQPRGPRPTPRSVEYTRAPWRVMEDSRGNTWLIVGESDQRGACQVARVPNATLMPEQQANARLIAQAPAMHSAAVRLLCAWGTEDAEEAMEELALVLSKAVET